MSGLNPQKYSKPKDCRISLRCTGERYVVTTHFEDNADEPFCRITIQKKDP
jgi:hypothetical protein